MNETSIAIKGTDNYPRIPILRPLAVCRFVRFWASEGSKVPQNGRFPAQDAPEPLCKIWHP